LFAFELQDAGQLQLYAVYGKTVRNVWNRVKPMGLAKSRSSNATTAVRSLWKDDKSWTLVSWPFFHFGLGCR